MKRLSVYEIDLVALCPPPHTKHTQIFDHWHAPSAHTFPPPSIHRDTLKIRWRRWDCHKNIGAVKSLIDSQTPWMPFRFKEGKTNRKNFFVLFLFCKYFFFSDVSCGCMNESRSERGVDCDHLGGLQRNRTNSRAEDSRSRAAHPYPQRLTPWRHEVVDRRCQTNSALHHHLSVHQPRAHSPESPNSS